MLDQLSKTGFFYKLLLPFEQRIIFFAERNFAADFNLFVACAT